MQFQENISLKPYNTFGLEVSAKYFVSVQNVEDLKIALRNNPIPNEPILILGGGSNMLLTQDYQGLVIKIDILGISHTQEGDDILVTAGAGENWHDFTQTTLEKGWLGLENLSLIPGCVGASPMQNIGAYGVEIKDRFVHLTALNRATLEEEKFDLIACEFGYRESVFKRKLKDKYIITSVTYRLSSQPNLKTSYGAIKDELSNMEISTPSAKDVAKAVINIRQSKLPDPREIGNSGSFFKNPVVPISVAEEIKQSHPEMPSYPVDENHVKLAAGWLIEQAGWKGKTFDNRYGVHKKQALVLVNYGGSKGSEIYDLSSQILESVKNIFGVQLEREVNII